MGKVFISTHGDGTAYVVPTYDLSDGEEFTIYSIPFEGASLDDILLWTSYDESIAITPSEELTVEYNSAWRNVYADIYFSGAPVPPEPEPPSVLTKFPWLIAKAANRWRNYGKY